LPAVQLARLRNLQQHLRSFGCAAGLFHDPCHVRYACDASNMTIWHKRNQIRYLMVPAAAGLAEEQSTSRTDGQGADGDNDRPEQDNLGPVTLWESLFVDAKGLENLIGHTIDVWVPNVPTTCCAIGCATTDIHKKIEQWASDLDQHLRPVCEKAGNNFRIAVQGGDPLQAFALEKKGYTISSGQQVLELARARKGQVPGELALIECGVQCCVDAMRYLQSFIKPGISENALWSKLHEYNIAVGGEYVETRLLNSGPRTSPWMQEASTRLLQGGDLVALDSDCTGPFGYFIDMSRTWHCPFPSKEDYTEEAKQKFWKQRELHRAARAQLKHNMAMVKPGMSFREVALKSWPIPEKYVKRRYGLMAHGNGLNGEYPYLYHGVDWELCGYDGVVEEGMTISFESFIAEDDEDGVKLEEHCVIGPEGVINLTKDLPFCDYLDGRKDPF